MGVRFRKSIKIAPGVKVNLGKKSVGVSVGGKYGGVSVNSRTGVRTRVSAPGTGLSYSSKIGGTRTTRPRSSSPSPSGPQEDLSNLLSQETLSQQLRRAKQNLFIVKFLYPVLGVFFLFFGLIYPVCFIVAVVLFYLSVHSRKRFQQQIPLLEQQASQIGAVQDDLSAICSAEDELERSKSAAVFFLHLEEIISRSLIVLEKAPSLSQYQTPEECRASIILLFDAKCSDIMQSEFEKTYKHLFELKTPKGVLSNIERFQAPYKAHLDKMTPQTQTAYENYVAKLHSVQPVFSE